MFQRAFISFSETDRPLVEGLTAEFDRAGIKYWIASRDIRGGEEFPAKLKAAIESSSVFLLFLTAASDASRYVMLETATAFEENRPILSVCRDHYRPTNQSLQLYLKLSQRLDVSARLDDADRALIVKGVQGLFEPDGGPGVPPSPWESTGFRIPVLVFYLLSGVMLYSGWTQFFQPLNAVLAFLAGLAIVFWTGHCNALVLATIGAVEPILIVSPILFLTRFAGLHQFDLREPLMYGIAAAGGGCSMALRLGRVDRHTLSLADWSLWLWPRRPRGHQLWRIEDAVKVGLLGATIAVGVLKLTGLQ